MIENECKASIGCHDRVHVLLNCSATTKKQITNPFSANPDEFFYFFLTNLRRPWVLSSFESKILNGIVALTQETDNSEDDSNEGEDVHKTKIKQSHHFP